MVLRLDPTGSGILSQVLESLRACLQSCTVGLSSTTFLIALASAPGSFSKDMQPGLTLRTMNGWDPTMNLPDTTSEVPFHWDFSSPFNLYFSCLLLFTSHLFVYVAISCWKDSKRNSRNLARKSLTTTKNVTDASKRRRLTF